MARTTTKAKPREQVRVIQEPKKANLPARADQAKNKRAVIGHNSAAQTAQMLKVVAQAAADPKVHVDKMRAILDMQTELIREQARREFNDAFRLLRADLPSINADGRIIIREKDQRTKERTGKVVQNTPFASYPNIMSICLPIMDKHGFSMWHSTEPHATDISRLVVIGYLEHTSGHQRVSKFPLPFDDTGSKNNLQGWGSSQNYGRRYTAIALLNIISHAKADQDNDGHGAAGAKPADKPQQPEPERPLVLTEPGTEVPKITQEQQDQLIEKMEACGVKTDQFKAHYRIEKLSDLPAELFTPALQACDAHKAKIEETRRK